MSWANSANKISLLLLLYWVIFLAHQFPEQYVKYSGDESQADYQVFTKKTLQYLAYKLNQATPQIDLYPVLGNNDSYNGNYNTEPQGAFLKDATDIFSTLIKNKNSRENFIHEFPNAG